MDARQCDASGRLSLRDFVGFGLLGSAGASLRSWLPCRLPGSSPRSGTSTPRQPTRHFGSFSLRRLDRLERLPVTAEASGVQSGDGQEDRVLCGGRPSRRDCHSQMQVHLCDRPAGPRALDRASR